MDYNKTINLPQTDFPMRAGLPQREPAMLERWEKIDVYNELLKKNEGKPRFSNSFIIYRCNAPLPPRCRPLPLPRKCHRLSGHGR